MNVFNEYARYYDLLYRDKDYQGEADYVHSLIKGRAPGTRSILNLGCGSGRHDRCLADRGYEVTGVDLSEEMLNIAKSFGAEYGTLDYFQGDVRTIRLEKTYDVVISLFHVMSYQTTNSDLLSSFATAFAHLKPGGLFIFDCWYGPGVLTDRPAVRLKELEDDALVVTRIATPVMHPEENQVDIQYLVFIRDKANDTVHEIRETHFMRYLFNPELQLLLSLTGFDAIEFMEWVTSARLDFTSWNAVIMAGKPS